MRPPENGLLAAALRGIEPLYRATIARRNRRFDKGRGVASPGIVTVSVGNLTVGGTGKTPLVVWLAETLKKNRHRPAVLSRGYGGQVGAGPVCVDRSVTCGAKRFGDEPWLMARRLAGIDIVVGSNRIAGAALARTRGADLLLLDDGFQHRQLARDLDIVLLDSRLPFDNGHLLPAGLLREPVANLSRAQVVILSRHDPEVDNTSVTRRVQELAPDAEIYAMRNRSLGWFDADGNPQEAPGRRFGFCGLGNPQPFREDLLADAAPLTGFRIFRDHHRYTTDECRQILQAARANDATPVTTEKDLMRMGRAPAELLAAVRVLHIDVEIDHPERLLQRISGVPD